MKKIAVLTGASGNLGPIWADILENNGFRVFPIDLPENDIRNLKKLKAAKEECLGIGVPAVIVNNAGIDTPPGGEAKFWDDPAPVMNVNYIGARNVTVTFLPEMLKEGRGNVVFIGSMLGFIAPDESNYLDGFEKPHTYGDSKAALWSFCRQNAVRYARYGIIFNMLALSGVDGNQAPEFKRRYTSKIPIGRMLVREDFENEFLTCIKARVPYDMPLFVGGGWTLK